jgi:hypothetical protein
VHSGAGGTQKEPSLKQNAPLCGTALFSFLRIYSGRPLTRTSASNQIVYERDDRQNEKNVDQTARHMKDEAQKPEDKQQYE